MATRKDVFAEADRVGLVLRAYSPGDGITRYRFFPPGTPDDQDYFGPLNGIYTALGAAEALTFIAGFEAGRESRS